MSKLYFAKYLPGEGEIKVGDKIRSESFGHPPVTVTKISEDGSIYWTDELDLADPMGSYYGVRKEKAQKVGKLFLCSRDIQVGDTVHYKYDHSLKWTVDKVFDTTFRSGSMESPLNVVYKVIGEISPEAVWIKEGDEFDEEDIYYNSLKIIRVKGYCHSPIKIKCPTCKKFH